MTKKKDTLNLVIAIVFSVVVVIVASSVASYFESGDTIRVKLDDNFEIALEAGAEDGYSWDIDFNDVYFELESKEYFLETDGVLGKEVFTLHALRVGGTTVSFYYRLLLDGEDFVVERKTYKVKII